MLTLTRTRTRTRTLSLTLTLTLTLALALALSRTAVALDRKSFCGRPGCNAAWSLQASNGFGTCGEQIKWTQGNIEGASSMADACEYVAAQASTPECAPCGAAAAEAEAVKRLSADEAKAGEEEEEEKDEEEEEEGKKRAGGVVAGRGPSCGEYPRVHVRLGF